MEGFGVLLAGRLALIGRTFIGKRSLLERLLGKALPEGDMSLPASTWRNLSLLIGAVRTGLWAGELWVAVHRAEADWVTFKVWMLTPLAFVTTLGLLFWMLRGAVSKENRHEQPRVERLRAALEQALHPAHARDSR